MKDQEEVYREAIEAALEAGGRLEGERLAPALAESIGAEHLRRSAAERLLYARNSPRVCRPEVVKWLLAQSFAARHTDPGRMLQLAEVSVELAEAMKEEAAWRGVLPTLRAEAWSHVANARRALGDLRGAEDALQRAQGYLEAGTSDILVGAWTCEVEAALHRARGAPLKDLQLREEAQRTYGLVGETGLRARTLLGLAHAYRKLLRLARGMGCLVQAGRDLSEASGGDDFGRLLHSLALHVLDRGYPHEALCVLRDARRVFARWFNSLMTARIHWLEARILAGLGHYAEEACLLEVVRKRFVEEKLAFTASQVSMELAAAYARLERIDLVEKLAEEMYPVFLSQELPVEATAALTLFVKAAKRHRLTAGRIAAVLRTLNDLEKKGLMRAREGAPD